MNDIPRLIPERYWRNLIFCLFVFAFIAIVACLALIIFFLATFDNNINTASLPSWVNEVALPLFRQYFTIALVVFTLVGFLLAVLIIIIGFNFLRADEFKVWLVEFKVSDKLKETQEQLEDEIKISVGLKENVSEIKELVDSQAILFLSPDVKKFIDYLDKIVTTSVQVFKSYGKDNVRISIWLGNETTKELRIIASHRISRETQKEFKLSLTGNGFVPFVLRTHSPQVKTSPNPNETNWMPCPSETYSTTSIFGQEVKIGNTPGWSAVICFSTDRDLARFPENAFSLEKDAAVVSFIASFVSFALTIANVIQVKISETETQPLIERIYQRYNNP